MGYQFEIVAHNMDEVVPRDTPLAEICTFLAHQKSKHLYKKCRETDTLLTVDTTVIDYERKEHLGKPKDEEQAFAMLKNLSGRWHSVISGICIRRRDKTVIKSCTTEVQFVNLSNDQIERYVQNDRPFDKAGSYGIQEWIGMIGVSFIKGSFYNVMGLPTHLVFQILQSDFNILPYQK